MQRFLTRYLTAMLCFAFALMWGRSALADECTDRVIDGAGVFGPGLSQVESAAVRLERAGADVRVRTIRTFGSHGTLDAYEAAMVARCPDWQAPNGGRKSNLIVMLMSVGERKAGLYYGSVWSSRLDGQWTTLLTSDIVPRFADGDFSGGFVAGLNGVRGMIAPAPPVTRTTPAPAPSRPTTVINEAPTDYTGLWWVLGIALFIGLVVLIVVMVGRAKAAAAQRKAAQQKAKLNKQACASGINELEQPFIMLEIRVNDIASKVSEIDAKPLQDAYVAAKAEFDGATARFGELDTTASDPDREKMSKEEYDQIADAYQGVLDKIRTAREQKTAIEADVAELKKKIEKAPERIGEADAKATDAVAFVDASKDRGFLTDDAEAHLQEAELHLEAARNALKAHKYGEVFSNCDEAEKAAKQAQDAAAKNERRKASLDAEVAGFAQRFEAVETSIQGGREAFAYISANFCDRSWEVIRGNGSEAEKRLAKARALVEDAEEAADMDEQRWDDAESLVREAGENLSRATSYMHSVTELKAQLDRAKASIGQEIEAAQADIDRAVAYERQHDDDIDDSEKDAIRRAKAKLQEARDEIASHDRPDYILAVKAALAANDMADRILERSRSQHEAMERKRKKCATLFREAERSISAAAEYIQDHRSDVDRDADEKLRQAKSHLAYYAQADTLDERISWADKADKAADSALEMAQRDFRNAEDERRRERERRERARRERERREREAREAEAAAAAAVATAILTSTTSSSRRRSSAFDDDDGWGSSGGGGSIGFGGFGGGGGGSIGFGGSGGGGGGSVGW